MARPQNIDSLSADEKRQWVRDALQRKQEGAVAPGAVRAPLEFGLMFFGGDDHRGAHKYDLLWKCAQFADTNGLSCIWLPERHFTSFGSLYPSPALLHAALARQTQRVHLRAGSVVMPLRNPIRVAEEWAVVDVLSGGRVGVSFASGWHPHDFALAPEQYADRHEAMFRGIESVRRLWRGETMAARSGSGEAIHVRTFPTPIQSELPIWLTAAGNPQTFERAGQMGAGVLTHLFDQRLDDLAAKIRRYRESYARHGWPPESANVTVALHTFVGSTLQQVRDQAGRAYRQFMRDNLHLLKHLAFSRGKEADLSSLPPDQTDVVIELIFEKYLGGRSLLGTPETCLDMAQRLAEAGVNEVACLMDFGPTEEAILDTLPHIAALQDACRMTWGARHGRENP